jgi:hypothetical protein
VSIFRALKHFVEFPEIVFTLKIFSKNKKRNLSYLLGPRPKVRPAPHPAQPPGPSATLATAALGVCTTPRLRVSRHIKAQPEPLCAP